VLRKVTEAREGNNIGQKDRDGEDRGKDRGEQDEKKQNKKKQKKPTNLLEDKEPDRSKPRGGKITTLTTDAAGRDRTNDIQNLTKRKLTE
jgi:hypothetical protein